MSVKNTVDTKILNQKTTQKNKIIIIDDDADQLFLYKFLFRNFNSKNEYITFSSPEKAIAYINKLKNQKYREIYNMADNINLIISDYNMHPLNGIELFRELEKMKVYAPFILFSSFLSNNVRNEAIDLGIIDCIQKDVNIEKTMHRLGLYLV